MTTNETPWVTRFTELMNLEVIRERVEVRPEPILNIRHMSHEEACRRVEDGLKRVFYPSVECLEILLKWVTLAWAHSLQMYENHHVFLEGVYRHESPLPEFYFPWCLTGLAGVGKSALVQALERLMPTPTTITAADGTNFPLVSYRAITVRALGTPKDILAQLSQREAGVRKLSELVRRVAYRDGWSLILQDEFQFATQSDRASTRVTQMILIMCYLGLPSVYVANFSLLHKLFSRNKEERDRLLGRFQFLHPDDHNGNDERMLLRWYRDVAPDVFVFDAEQDREAIHNLTASVKRHVIALLTIGFAMAFAEGGSVDYAVLEKAYKSRAYATFRDDVEALPRLYGPFRNRRKDLWCPIEAVALPSEDQYAQRQRQMRVDEKALDCSMTVQERKAWADLSKKSSASRDKPSKATVASKRTKKADAERLRENNVWFSGKV